MREPIICPDCGVEMNFHAEKLVYREPEPSARARIAIDEIHACPSCGKIESRAAFEKA
jgi:rubredoxin